MLLFYIYIYTYIYIYIQDINVGTIATDNVLKEVICNYFVNRDLSDGELSESDTVTDSNANDDESAKFRQFFYLKFLLSCPKKPILR